MTVRSVAFLHGAYYFVTGLWPLVSMATFLAVTGPKTDLWLVRTVGALIAASGAAVLLAARAADPLPAAIMFLAVGQILALTLIESFEALRKRISKIYLADAAFEIILLLGWLFAPGGVLRL